MESESSQPYLSISWATCPKWATRPGADCAELVETPTGRFGIVLVDVQGSGSAGARKLGLSLISFCRNLLASGVSAELAALATAQFLAEARDGKVAASIHCLLVSRDQSSVDMSGFGPLSIAILEDGQPPEYRCLEAQIAGFSTSLEPESVSLVIPVHGSLVVANDGAAADRDALARLTSHIGASDAGDYLTLANDAEGGRPRSDKSIVVMSRCNGAKTDRRLTGTVTLPQSNGFAHGR